MPFNNRFNQRSNRSMEDQEFRACEYQIQKYFTKIDNIQLEIELLNDRKREYMAEKYQRILFERNKPILAVKQKEEKQKAVKYLRQVDRLLNTPSLRYNPQTSK